MRERRALRLSFYWLVKHSWGIPKHWVGLARKTVARVTFLVSPAEWLRAKHLLRIVWSPHPQTGPASSLGGCGPGPEAWKMLLTTLITTQLEVFYFLTSCLFRMCFTGFFEPKNKKKG